jgi:uncharacterized membrane protein
VISAVPRVARTLWNRDPLLAGARLALVAAMGISAFFAVGCITAIPAMLIMNESLMAGLASAGGPPETIWAVIAVTVLAGVVAAMSFVFFREFYRIVATVESGNPFVAINAKRLQTMGWISVAVHVLGIPLSMTSKWLDQILHNQHQGFEFSYFGLLLALVLFVLARVFREGTRLSEEVEGTV